MTKGMEISGKAVSLIIPIDDQGMKHKKELNWFIVYDHSIITVEELEKYEQIPRPRKALEDKKFSTKD